jgi:hypothetical protein
MQTRQPTCIHCPLYWTPFDFWKHGHKLYWTMYLGRDWWFTVRNRTVKVLHAQSRHGL